MELPITIVFEPPSRVELRALLRSRWLWVAAVALLAAAVGALVLAVNVSRAEARATSTSIDLHVTSQPGGAELWLDGYSTGRTPAALSVAPGPHRIKLKSPHAIDASYALDVEPPGATLDAVLWRSQPLVTRLRPSLPGSGLVNARLLPDGRLALTLDLGSNELQAWRLDPLSGAQDALVTGIASSRLAISPDAGSFAYIGPTIGPSLAHRGGAESVIWLLPAADPNAAPTAVWRAPGGEALVDLTWTPDQRALLAVTSPDDMLEREVRSRLWLVEPGAGTTRQLFSLPSRIVPGAFAWRPDGQQVALLARARAVNALCLLGLDGEFRYLADLEPSSAGPLPYPPLAWSPDGQRMAFVAPRQEPALPGSWLQEQPRRAVYVSEAGEPTPRLLTEIDARAVAWREGGQLLAFGRARDGGQGLVAIDAAGQEERLLDLPLKWADAYAADWDMTRAQILVASRVGADVEYWLVRLGLEDRP